MRKQLPVCRALLWEAPVISKADQGLALTTLSLGSVVVTCVPRLQNSALPDPTGSFQPVPDSLNPGKLKASTSAPSHDHQAHPYTQAW